MKRLMTVEPTPEDAERERSLRELSSATEGWTRFRVVRPDDPDLQRREHALLVEHGYTLWRNEGSTRVYQNPKVQESKASVADELERSTSHWTQIRSIRQFADSAEGRARLEATTTVMREHGYEPGPPVPDGQGRINVPYLSAEAVALANEERAFTERYGPSSLLIGLPTPREAFECVECGRWADVIASAEVYAKLVQTELTYSTGDWIRVRSAATPSSPLRPAFLQRELGEGYERAVAVIDAAVRLGMLEVTKTGVVAAEARCAQCYERRAAPERGTANSRIREAVPSQLRFRVFQRDAFRCQYCGRAARDGATLHLDHIVPVAAGGETNEGNLITACETCNLGKSGNGVV